MNTARGIPISAARGISLWHRFVGDSVLIRRVSLSFRRCFVVVHVVTTDMERDKGRFVTGLRRCRDKYRQRRAPPQKPIMNSRFLHDRSPWGAN